MAMVDRCGGGPMNLRTRLGKIEAALGGGPARAPTVIFQSANETEEQAIARHCGGPVPDETWILIVSFKQAEAS